MVHQVWGISCYASSLQIQSNDDLPFFQKASARLSTNPPIANLLRSVEVKDALLQGMQAQLIDRNCTKFSKEESKQTSCASLEKTEEDLFKVEDKEKIDFIKKGLTDILKIQKSIISLLNEDLKEKTDRVDMYRDLFDQNLNCLMSYTNIL